MLTNQNPTFFILTNQNTHLDVEIEEDDVLAGDGRHVVDEVGQGDIVLQDHLERKDGLCENIQLVSNFTSKGRLKSLVLGLILPDQSMFAGMP